MNKDMKAYEWLQKNDLSYDVWDKKYRFNGESFDEWLDRISSGDDRVRQLIYDKKFLYGGRILANLNTGTKQGLSNCTTFSYVEDSLDDIMDTAKCLALSYKKEAGVGVALSKIRPRGAKISATHTSDGVIGFLKIFNAVTENVKRGGARRGAMLAGLHCDHPDIMDFIKIKKNNKGASGEITSANLSVLITDEFMEHYLKGESYRKDFVVEATGEVIPHTVDTVAIMDAIVDTPKTSFEPGILFVDRYKEGHLFGALYGDKELFNNACCFTGDEKLLTTEGYKSFDELSGTKTMIINKNGGLSESRVWSSGVKDVYQIKSYKYNIAKCTADHVFLTTDGDEVEAKDLIGKQIMPNLNESIRKDEWFVKLGFIQGDGATGRLDSKTHKGIEVYIGENDHDVYKYFNIDTKPQSSKTYAYYIKFDLDKMKELGMSSKPVHEREFPSTYDEWSIVQKASFLKGLYSANGYVLNKYGRIGIKTTSKSEAVSILKTLSEDFGINAYITTNKPKKIEWHNGTYISKESYDINISEYKSKLTFSECIGFIHQYKKNILRQTLIEQAPKITSVKYFGPEKVYDFEEPHSHFGIVNGFVVHNSEFIGVKGTVCLLGSMNLSAYVKEEFGHSFFDFDTFGEDVKVAIDALDKAHDYGCGRNGLRIQDERAYSHRGLGLGIMGLADMFMKLGIKYGSQESVELSEKIAKLMRDKAIEESQHLGKIYGQPMGILEDEKKMEELGVPYIKGLRNNSLLSIAPAGSISLLLNISTGIEPVFRMSYTRKTESLNKEDKYYEVFHKPIQDIIDKFGYKPDYCIDTRDVSVEEKVNVISAWQKYVDLSISNTTNFKEDATVDEIKKLYVYGWQNGVKGLTVYVDGSIEGVLNDIGKNTTEEEVPRGAMLKVPSDTIYIPKDMKTGCGNSKVMIGFSPSENRITDVYYIAKGQGGCSKNIQGEAILISQILRCGGNLEDIKKSFNGIDACSSCTISRMKGNEISGKNCPNILLNLVLETQRELQVNPVAPVVDNSKTEIPTKDKQMLIDNKIICPMCGELLRPEGGCYTCNHCGYSKCD